MLTDDENIIDISSPSATSHRSSEDCVFSNRRPDQIVACRRVGDSRGRRQEQDGLRCTKVASKSRQTGS
jgi:hypothetical protein